MYTQVAMWLYKTENFLGCRKTCTGTFSQSVTDNKEDNDKVYLKKSIKNKMSS